MKVNRVKKRGLATALCILLLFSMFAPTASAAAEREKITQSRYSRIAIFSIDLYINISGLSYPYSNIKLSYDTDTANLTMELQQLNGGKWTTIKSWDTSGSGTVYLDKTWYVSPGYSYRVYTTAKVYNSSGILLETAFATSNSVNY